MTKPGLFLSLNAGIDRRGCHGSIGTIKVDGRMYPFGPVGPRSAISGAYFFAGTMAGFVLKFPVLRLLGVEHAKNRLDPVARAKRRRSHRVSRRR